MLITMLSKRKLFKVVIRCTLCSWHLGSSWKCSVGTHVMVLCNSIIPYHAKCIEIEVNFLFPAMQDFYILFDLWIQKCRRICSEKSGTDKFTVIIHGEDDGAKLSSINLSICQMNQTKLCTIFAPFSFFERNFTTIKKQVREVCTDGNIYLLQILATIQPTKSEVRR